MPFNWRHTYCLGIPWPWYDLNLIYDIDLRHAKLSFSIRWPWSLPSDLDTQTWPRYGPDVLSYQKLSLYVNSFKSYNLNRHTGTHAHTDTHTDTHTNMTKTLLLSHTRWVKISHCVVAETSTGTNIERTWNEPGIPNSRHHWLAFNCNNLQVANFGILELIDTTPIGIILSWLDISRPTFL